MDYIKDFSDTDVCEAADYLMCLRPPRKLEEAIQGLLVETIKDDLREHLAKHLRVSDHMIYTHVCMLHKYCIFCVCICTITDTYNDI